MRKMSLLITGLLLIIDVMGCRYVPANADIVGTWRNPDGATIEFGPTTYKATNISYDAVYGERASVKPSRKRFSATGTWEIPKEFPDRIDLDFAKGIGTGDWANAQLFYSGKGNSLRIFFFIGDPDNNDLYKFTKVPDAL